MSVSSFRDARRAVPLRVTDAVESLPEALHRIADLEACLEAIGGAHMVATFDMAGKLLDANPRFLETFGYCAEDILGRHHSMFVAPEDQTSPEYEAFWTRLKEGEFASAAYKRIGRGGREIWIRATYTPIPDRHGAFSRVIKYATDVTASKLLNADAESQIAAISKSQAVIEFDLDGIIIAVNDRFLNVVGYPREEVIGRHHRLFMPKDSVSGSEYETFWSALRAGEYRSGEFPRINKDGDEVWLQASYNPIRDLNGNPFKIVKYAIDVTDSVRRAMQETVREAAAAAKTDFLANMSHELRTPLTSILGFANVLAADPALDPVHAGHVRLIQNAGQTLLSVVNDVLDFSKLESGAVKLSPAPVDIRALTEEVVAVFAPTAAEKGLTLTCQSDAGTSLQLDAARLRQVLFNLVGNALKFTEHGGVQITVSTRDDGDAAVALTVSVMDTGKGVDPAQRDRLFHRFVQEDSSISRRFGGTGLGLSISKQLISLMGGEIGCESDGSTGSTFWFRVPAAIAAPIVVVPFDRPAPVSKECGPIRILLAEDHPANQRLIQALLSPLNVVLDCVDNGAAAIEANGRADYDLILMDMQMPVMDGLTATREIRAGGGSKSSTPIVALTANILPAQIERCLASGMQGHLTKPVDIEELHRVVALYRPQAPASVEDTRSLPLAASGAS